MERTPDRRRTRRGRTGATIALIAVGLLTGCGSSGEEDLSTEAYIVKADAVCAQYTANSGTLEKQFNQALKSSDLESAAQDFEDQAADVTATIATEVGEAHSDKTLATE